MNRDALIRTELAAVDGQAPTPETPLGKHLAMAAAPFRFFRGSAGLFYRDLADGVAALPPALADLPPTRIQGDCHFSNFGFLTEEGCHTDDVIWCPNDYDDACMGPAGWDLLRYGVSLFLAADFARGIQSGRYSAEIRPEGKSPDIDHVHDAVEAFLVAYGRTCADIVDDPDVRDRVVNGFAKDHALGRAERKARRRAASGKDFATKSSLAKAAERQGDQMRFRDRPDRFEPLDPELAAEIIGVFRPHVDDRIHDVVRRLGAGTGSLDLDRFYLLVGPEPVDPRLNLYHVVEIKQQRPAAPLRHFPDLHPTNRLAPAHLTVDSQRRMQRRPDLVLDEAVWRDAHWLIRSRHHARVGLDPEDLITRKPKRFLGEIATASGEALALAHGRNDRRATDFEAAIAAVLNRKGRRNALIDAAAAYAHQVVEDWRHLHGLLGLT